jgi:hypothetical protein
MPTPRLSIETLQAAVTAINLHGSQCAAAKALGIPRSTLENRLREARTRGIDINHAPEKGGLADVVESLRNELDVCKRSLADAVRPRFTIRQDNVSRSGKIKGVIIGDAHDSPHIPDKRRFEWIGAHINKIKPDFAESIGDFATIDSLNGHEGNETFAGRSKPTFAEDMASLNLAYEALGSKINGTFDLHLDEGNHERRIYLFENTHPETNGTMVFQFHKVLERHGWTHSPYGHINYRGGVGLVHAALNRLGKTYGGKTAENTIANDSVHDLIIGHSHVERMHKAPKIGGNGFVRVLNVGCALPDGHIENYAKHALNGWSYGIAEVTIQHGHISDYQWISMARLEEMYG